MPDLSIICVNWNSLEYMRQCLASIYANTRELAFEVIIVDNASSEGDPEALQTEFPGIILVRSERNLGFAGANNLGYEHSSGANLLFLNPDTLVLGRAVNCLMEALEACPDAGIVGGKLLNSDLSIQTSCIQRFPTILNQVLDVEWLRLRFANRALWGIRVLFSEPERPAEVEVISGACLMIRRSVFERAGRFSREYFMYAEDVDLCYRVRQLGLKSYYVGGASVVHHGGGASRKRAASHWAAIAQRDAILTFCRITRGHGYASMYRAAIAAAALGRLAVMACLYPIEALTGGSSWWKCAFGKWAAILRWAAGFDRQTVRFSGSQ